MMNFSSEFVFADAILILGVPTAAWLYWKNYRYCVVMTAPMGCMIGAKDRWEVWTHRQFRTIERLSLRVMMAPVPMRVSSGYLTRRAALADLPRLKQIREDKLAAL